MRRILIASMAFIASVSMFAQDIRGVYFHRQFSNSAVLSISLTLFTDASKNISRPVVRVLEWGTISPPYFTLTPTSSVNVNGINLATYTGTQTFIFGNFMISYSDSFWVDGVKNYTRPDKLNARLFAALGSAPSIVDSGPEVTNLPVSPSNFTISGNQVLYNPYCQDADGDSLSYVLLDGLPGSIMFDGFSNYCYLPSTATINPTTGLFSFSKDSTDLERYVFSIGILEWRKNGITMEQIGVTQLGFALTTNLTLGLKDVSDPSFSFGLYPNPVKETLSFKSYANESEKVKLEISNALGEVIIRKGDFDLSQNLDVSGLRQGIYIINVSDGTRTFSNKFVKADN